MEEIKIFLNKDLTNEVEDNIKFDTVVAGEITVRKVYVQSQINSKLNLSVSLEGENVSIVKEIKELLPKEVKEVIFELNPKITTMKPITAKLKIKLNYVVG